MEIGRSSSVYSAYSSVRSIPRTSPSELTISVTTNPHPPCFLTRRRNAESVMPAMGASAKGDARSTVPIFIRLIGFHIRGIDFDADGLADQINRQHEARLRGVFAHQAPDDALERTVHDFDHHAFVNERTRIVLQLAADQQTNAVELVVGDRG